MIKLENLNAQLNKDVFKEKDSKFLRISISSVVKKTKNPGNILGPTSILWNQTIALPILYQKQFTFQIYDKNNSDSNPENINPILYGTLSIKNSDEENGIWDILTKDKQKIGELSAKIISQTPSSLTFQNSQDFNQTKILRIKSIVAKVDDIKDKKAFVSISVGENTINTKAVKSRNGELIFVDPYQIEKQSKITQAKLTIFLQVNSSQTKILGQGIFYLLGNKPPRKVLITKDNNNVGEAFIDSRIMRKQNRRTSSIAETSSRYTIDGQSTYIQKTKSPKTIDITKFQNFGISSSSRITRAYLNSSQFSDISKKKKSIVNTNNDIIFGREKRFQLYQDKQNDRITYLEDKSFEFKNPRNNKFYRGASIGYGEKTDFAKECRQNPGVGDYRLPSIWDRY